MKSYMTLKMKIDDASTHMHCLKQGIGEAPYRISTIMYDLEYVETKDFYVAVAREERTQENFPGDSLQIGLSTVFYANKKTPWKIRSSQSNYFLSEQRNHKTIDENTKLKSFEYISLKSIGGNSIRFAWANDEGELINKEDWHLDNIVALE